MILVVVFARGLILMKTGFSYMDREIMRSPVIVIFTIYMPDRLSNHCLH